ncbi:MAG TPA: prepilin peptidase, partial [Kofleriaceae bacterium]|nr:prepilin peptidase [Kofleriaceae bacterium]
FRVTHREGLGLGDGMLLALIGALLGWRGVLVSLFGGSVIGSVIGITAVLVARAGGPPPAEPPPAEPPPAEPPAPAPGADAAPAAEAAPAEGEKPSVMRAELPFGPFLAMAAVLYLFAEPWIEFHFHLPGG